MHGLRQQTEEMIEHLMPQLDAGLFGEPGRTLDVGEQHRDALALADHGAGGTQGTVAQMPRRIADGRGTIGRASCRDRVCPYVLISVVALSLKKIQIWLYCTYYYLILI